MCFVFVIRMPHFSCCLFLINLQRHMHSMCVWNMINQSKSLQTRYETTYMYDRYYMCFSVKEREFDLEGDLVGVPHTWNLSAQPFITLLKLI